MEDDSPFCRMDIRVFWGLLLITNIGPSGHIYNEIDKIAHRGCFVCHSRCVWRIFQLSLLNWQRTKFLPLDYGLRRLAKSGSNFSTEILQVFVWKPCTWTFRVRNKKGVTMFVFLQTDRNEHWLSRESMGNGKNLDVNIVFSRFLNEIF